MKTQVSIYSASFCPQPLTNVIYITTLTDKTYDTSQTALQKSRDFTPSKKMIKTEQQYQLKFNLLE